MMLNNTQQKGCVATRQVTVDKVTHPFCSVLVNDNCDAHVEGNPGCAVQVGGRLFVLRSRIPAAALLNDTFRCPVTHMARLSTEFTVGTMLWSAPTRASKSGSGHGGQTWSRMTFAVGGQKSRLTSGACLTHTSTTTPVT